MDGSAAIERNLEALKRILAALIAMAGFTTGPHPEVRSLSDGEGEPRRTLPRHLHRAVLAILRPAEAAARRLIIAMSHSLVVTLPLARPRRAAPRRDYIEIPVSAVAHNGVGTGLVLPPNALRRIGPDGTVEVYLIPRDNPAGPAPTSRGKASRRPCNTVFRLTDPLRNPFRRPPRRQPPQRSIPRIDCFDEPRTPIALKPLPSQHDPVNAASLARRLAGLASALDDLPRQVQRFARWRARRDRARQQGKFHRVSPLRRGRPPGGRLSCFDPDARRRRNIREVDEVLAHAHELAVYALEHPDTS